jgi:hypothetical protein
LQGRGGNGGVPETTGSFGTIPGGGGGGGGSNADGAPGRHGRVVIQCPPPSKGGTLFSAGCCCCPSKEEQGMPDVILINLSVLSATADGMPSNTVIGSCDPHPVGGGGGDIMAQWGLDAGIIQGIGSLQFRYVEESALAGVGACCFRYVTEGDYEPPCPPLFDLLPGDFVEAGGNPFPIKAIGSLVRDTSPSTVGACTTETDEVCDCERPAGGHVLHNRMRGHDRLPGEWLYRGGRPCGATEPLSQRRAADLHQRHDRHGEGLTRHLSAVQILRLDRFVERADVC